MSMVPNTIDRNGRLWIRCPFCGDSDIHQNKAHCILNVSGNLYCYKCNQTGKLNLEDFIELVSQYPNIDLELYQNTRNLHNCQELTRPTLLHAYQDYNDLEEVFFEARSNSGKHRGWHKRNMYKKVMINEGERGLGFVGEILKSSPNKPVILVEGPFDVIDERHVCCFGTISKQVIPLLNFHYIWLWPDPDVYNTEAKLKKFQQFVYWVSKYSFVEVLGVILSDEDPDKATKKLELTVQQFLKETL